MAQRKSKYAHVTPNLPRLPLVELGRREIVEAVKVEALTPVEEEESLFDPTPGQTLDAMEALFVRLTQEEKYRLRCAHHTASGFADAYVSLRRIQDKVDAWKSNIQLLLDVATELMVEQMEEEGLTALRLDSGASVETRVEPYGQVKDKEAFRLWCIAHGYERNLQLWPATMNSIVKERCLEGEPPPDGVEVFSKTMVRLNGR